MSTHHCSGEQGCLLQEDAPDEEDSANSSASPPRRSGKITTNSENLGEATTGNHQSRADDGALTLKRDDDKESEGSVSDVDLDEHPEARPRSPYSVLAPKSLPIYPSSDEEDFQARIPHFRILPILSGVTIPLCILLDLPLSLRAVRYTHTHVSTIAFAEPTTLFLNIGIALSMLCGVLANLCLVVRFLERHIKTMTVLCILFLSIHDMINIVALTTFKATGNDYNHSQTFWMTFCSTITSTFTNVTLIVDIIQTSYFSRSGSGLTRSQRSLVIITIGLFGYVVLGALVNSLLVDLTFVDGLYFTVVSMATIGFGDIVPESTSSRIFICIYATLGVINLVFAVGYVRETVLEGLDFGYRKRLLAIQERRRTARLHRRAEKRWKQAVVWRLQQGRAPVWIPKETGDREPVWSVLTSRFWRALRSASGRSMPQSHRQRSMQLNLWALSPSQLEAAALEAGAPLSTFLPASFYDAYGQDRRRRASPWWVAGHPVYHRHQDEHSTGLPTYRWFGSMAVVLTKLSVAIYESGGDGIQNASVGTVASSSSGSLETKVDYREDVADTEKKAYYARVGLCWAWLFIFWMGGAALFTATEGWTYGLATYFCLVSFTAIGYGDVAPTTPAGRSIFVVWALIGFAIMSFFISVVSEAYAVRYKGILSRNSFKHVVRRYRKRDGIESSEKVQRARAPAEVELREDAGNAEDELPPVDDGVTLAPASTHDLRTLEQISHQITAETRRIRQYMRLASDVDGCSVEADDAVRRLIDDVMGGRRLTEDAQRDVLRDAESRQTLMLLGIERSVRALVSVSEQAIATVQEQDRTIAMLERKEREGSLLSA